MPDEPIIINRGRGPEIRGTRITVYDIMDYHRHGWHYTRIATWLRLSTDEVLAAIRYIEDHKDEVTARYPRILDRDAAGNPPALQARLDETHRRVQEMLKNRRREKAKEESVARATGGYER
jgi:uncharacterized protein (DUF433 family)